MKLGQEKTLVNATHKNKMKRQYQKHYYILNAHQIKSELKNLKNYIYYTSVIRTALSTYWKFLTEFSCITSFLSFVTFTCPAVAVSIA